MSRRSNCSIIAGLSALSSATQTPVTREGPVCILLPCRGTLVLTAPSEGWDEGSVGTRWTPLSSGQFLSLGGFPPQSQVLSLFRKLGNMDFKAVSWF